MPKVAYEDFVAQVTKVGDLYADLGKETYKSFESSLARAVPEKERSDAPVRGKQAA
jgi:hypothetical protein